MWVLIKFSLLGVLISCVIQINADAIDRTARKGVVLKLLRDMVNQTKADKLNLPANATSIRENITDTFSCENRTYGYYADVDNECQIFHVCLTSQGPSSRNTTYRWSFICPNETIFNQEVLTCTRPRDSIPCEESPMFYHLNDEIGKMPNDTETMQANQGDPAMNNNNKERRKPLRKQNIIVANLMEEVRKEKLVMDNFEEELAPVIEENIDDSEEKTRNAVLGEAISDKSEPEAGEEKDMKVPLKEVAKLSNKETASKMNKKENKTKSINKKYNKDENLTNLYNKYANVENMNNKTDVETKPVIHAVNSEYKMKGKRMENARLSAERSFKRKGRKISRGSIRFKADSY